MASATDRYRAVVRTPPATSILAPVPFKQYPASPRYRLPGGTGGPPASGPLALLEALFRPYAPRRLHYASVAGSLAMLGAASGVGLDPWCHELQVAGLRRTVPSGGGFYPVELYAAVPGDADLPAGIYHYDALDHVAEQIRTGDPGPELRRALPAPQRPAAGALLLAGRKWKNAGKYGNLCYHLTALDVGVVLGQGLAGPVPVRVSFYFLDDVLDRLLGLTPRLETVFAAMLLDRIGPGAGDGEPMAGPPPPGVGLRPDRRYRSMVHPAVPALDAASRITDPSQLPRTPVVPPGPTSPDSPDHLAGRSVRLPPAGPLRYRDPGGRQSAVSFDPRPIQLDQLATVLAEAVRSYPSDVTGTAEADPPVELHCVTSGIAGVPDGPHRYHPSRHTLTSRPATAANGPAALRGAITGLDPQLVAASTSLFLIGRYGPGGGGSGPGDGGAGERWYRVANMLAGAILLRICQAAAGLGLGSRPNLGFHPAALAGLLGLAHDQAPLVHVMVGHPAPRPGCLDLWLPDPSPAPDERW